MDYGKFLPHLSLNLISLYDKNHIRPHSWISFAKQSLGISLATQASCISFATKDSGTSFGNSDLIDLPRNWYLSIVSRIEEYPGNLLLRRFDPILLGDLRARLDHEGLFDNNANAAGVEFLDVSLTRNVPRWSTVENHDTLKPSLELNPLFSGIRYAASCNMPLRALEDLFTD
jgi:hypothetical protein